MRVTVLGCGASTGVPAIGPDWGRCDPADPRNRRRRVSALVEIADVAILIDTSPDLREQFQRLSENLTSRADRQPVATEGYAPGPYPSSGIPLL
jgi:phosphoribosyl 1,2-cyclic phosphodiesterase